MNLTAIVTFFVSAFTSLAGAGPWGIGAMVLAGAGVLFGVGYLVRQWNKGIDASDTAAADADAGNTATDLRNQGTTVDNELDVLTKQSDARKK